MSAYDNIGECTHNAHHSVKEQVRVPRACPHVPHHSPLFYTLIDVLDRRSLMLQLVAPLILILQELNLLTHLSSLGGRDNDAQLAPVALVAHDESCW